MSAVHSLELDLDVFAGPLDLLLSLVLREELDLLEVDLADVVLAYVDHLEAVGELELESTTEFLVLIAALLELKTRLMLPGAELEETDELVPERAADELLARMLAYARYRGAAAHLREAFEAGQPFLWRSAPLPAELGRERTEHAEAVFDPARLGAAIGGLLRRPEPVDLAHMRAPQVTVADRLRVLRSLLARGRFDFDAAVDGADRATVCVTVWALLELYKRGEATWEQGETFGAITVTREERRPQAALA